MPYFTRSQVRSGRVGQVSKRSDLAKGRRKVAVNVYRDNLDDKGFPLTRTDLGTKERLAALPQQIEKIKQQHALRELSAFALNLQQQDLNVT